MPSPSPAYLLVVFHCLVAASAATAQPLPGPSMPSVRPGVATTPPGGAHALPHAPSMAAPPPSTAPAGLGYRSVFEGYVPFSDGPPTSWREANETVRRRGGWKAYAQEAEGGDAAADAPGVSGASPAGADPGGASPVRPAHSHSHSHSSSGSESGSPAHPHPATVPGPASTKERP